MQARKRKSSRIRKSRRKVWFGLPALHATYPVYEVEKPKIDGDDVAGGCYMPPGNSRRIVVQKDLTLEQQRVVLWHEAFHAIFNEAGLTEECADESLCEMLSLAVMRIRKDVPWL